MTDVRIVEDAVVAGTKRGKDGYLYADVRAARTGVQDYAGFELGHPERERVRVYRPPEEVFHRDSLRSYAGRPVTVRHPPELVTADNWKKHAVGQLGQDVAVDGERVSVGVMLMDADAIAGVEAGTREVSMGYTSRLDMLDAPETLPDGREFDAVMRDLRMNHLAIVPRGRAGPEFRIGDQAWGASPITTDAEPSESTDGTTPPTTTEDRCMSTRTIVVDGLPVEITDAGAAAVEKLQGEVKALADAAKEAKAASDTAAEAARATADAELAERDKALAAKDAEIDALKAKVLTDDALDARVAERAAILSKAKALTKDADFAGKSDREIKHAAVTAVRGATALDGKSDAYIDAAFDLLDVPKGTGDSMRDALISRDAVAPAAADHGQSEYQRRISDAWKTTTEAA